MGVTTVETHEPLLEPGEGASILPAMNFLPAQHESGLETDLIILKKVMHIFSQL
jgi:hypothetical protein